MGNSEVEPSIQASSDGGTADHWIERNSTMIRLPGQHPFNSEVPHGFITPVDVPHANCEEWTVEVTGLVKSSARFSGDQLMNDFPSRDFNLGSVWRGVPVWEVLKRCGIMSSKEGALNVCFEGAGGGSFKYRTSLNKEMAMDPARDVILAYMKNGERLTPEHGFPVLMIIPGGQMVKWLKRIIVIREDPRGWEALESIKTGKKDFDEVLLASATLFSIQRGKYPDQQTVQRAIQKQKLKENQSRYSSELDTAVQPLQQPRPVQIPVPEPCPAEVAMLLQTHGPAMSGVVKKTLTETDVNRHHCRLKIPKLADEVFLPMLVEGREVENGMVKKTKVKVYVEGSTYDMEFKTWTGGVSHVLSGREWNLLCDRHGLKAHDVVELRLFRDHKHEVCFLLSYLNSD